MRKQVDFTVGMGVAIVAFFLFAMAFSSSHPVYTWHTPFCDSPRNGWYEMNGSYLPGLFAGVAVVVSLLLARRLLAAWIVRQGVRAAWAVSLRTIAGCVIVAFIAIIALEAGRILLDTGPHIAHADCVMR